MQVKLLKEVNLKWHWIKKDTVITLPFLIEDKKNKRRMEIDFNQNRKTLDCSYNSKISADGYCGGSFYLKESEYKIVKNLDISEEENFDLF